MPATNSAPATSQDTPAAWASAARRATTTSSAWLARWSVQPRTSSPTANAVTSAPTSSTTPARSLPSPGRERRGPTLKASLPDRCLARLIPAALTRTSTSPGPASGARPCARTSTSTPPYHRNGLPGASCAALSAAQVARGQPALVDAPAGRPLDPDRRGVRARRHDLVELGAVKHQGGSVVGRPPSGRSSPAPTSCLEHRAALLLAVVVGHALPRYQPQTSVRPRRP